MKLINFFLIYPILNKINFHSESLNIINTKFNPHTKSFSIDLKIIGKEKNNHDTNIFLKVYPNYQINNIYIRNKKFNNDFIYLNVDIDCKKDDAPFYEIPLGNFYEFNKKLKSELITY